MRAYGLCTASEGNFVLADIGQISDESGPTK